VSGCPTSKEAVEKSFVIITLVRRDDFSHLLFECFDVAVGNAVGLWSVLFSLKRYETSSIRQDSNLRPWLLCNSRKIPRKLKKLVTRAPQLSKLLIGNWVSFQPLGKKT
jgi:hypothetical protein